VGMGYMPATAPEVDIPFASWLLVNGFSFSKNLHPGLATLV
jgi:hypothetical protein